MHYLAENNLTKLVPFLIERKIDLSIKDING